MDTNQNIDPHAIVTHPFTDAYTKIKADQLCRRCDFSRSDFEDLCQDMRVYLLQKAHLYDPARGRVEAFIANALNTWVAMHLRYRNRECRHQGYKAASLERTPVECDGDITTLGAVLLEEDAARKNQIDPMASIEHFEVREAIEYVMQDLEPEDRELLAHVAEHGVASAARLRGVSRRQINNTMARLRERFEEAGLSAADCAPRAGAA